MPVSPRQAAYLDALGVTRYARRTAPSTVSTAPGVPASQAPAVVEVPRPAAPAQSVTETPATDPAAAWQALHAQIAACTACELSRTRTHTVPGVGDRQADWMVIGEAPGAEEDARGEPFVGPAGKLLDAMLHAVGRSRQRGVYITNIVKCRPPNNRDPAPQEAQACAGFLQRQIALVEPKLILAVGKVAAHNLLERDDPVGRLRGQVWQWRGQVPVVVTYHPAYLLRSPLEKRKVWDDLCLAQDVLERDAG